MDLINIASTSLAAGLLATSATRMLASGWQLAAARLRDRLEQAELHGELSRATEHARLSSELKRQIKSTNNSSWRVMEVVETNLESDDCLSLYLQDPLKPSATAEFRAGQFVLVRPALGGSTLPSRCYSLSDCPGQPWWRITVKRQNVIKEQSKSLSNWIHEYLRAGDCLLVSGPQGEFTFDPFGEEPLLLLAAGIGITPLLSMIKTSLSATPDRPITILYQVSDEDHWAFGESISRWSQQFDRFKSITYMSRQTELPEVAGGQVRRGKYSTSEVLEHLEPTANVYLCGPDRWMKQLTDGLSIAGVASQRIHFESFHPSDQQDTNKAIEPWSIHFVRSQVTTPASTSANTLWQTASDAGISLPASCHSGACGTCKLKKLRGEVAYRKTPTCSHSDDEIVACLAQPVGRLEVDA